MDHAIVWSKGDLTCDLNLQQIDLSKQMKLTLPKLSENPVPK